MSIGIIGKKIGMTQLFDEKGFVVPVTLLKVGPCTITAIQKENIYTKIQIGYEEMNPNKLTKPMVGHFAKNNLPCFKYLKEYKVVSSEIPKIGEIIKIDKIKQEQLVSVSGISIGKGFSGYQKRHKFSRGPMSHGSKNHREPGSIGAGTTPGRVFPGKKMAGRMGNKKVHVKNLKVIKTDNTNNILILKGCIPGKKGNIIYINQK
uniref:Large ribosomal subunit protein uL3c n=1 Tax=Vertebrata isogona TaxID=2006944 RepID=A0A1Z1MEN5_9FLOR|nr:ribosomal protein L3 [Vertebrata isogona]ARW64548.1 ribosomal protein L3 [Vertebrata isogona]